jgi:hypothetical protein
MSEDFVRIRVALMAPDTPQDFVDAVNEVGRLMDEVARLRAALVEILAIKETEPAAAANRAFAIAATAVNGAVNTEHPCPNSIAPFRVLCRLPADHAGPCRSI